MFAKFSQHLDIKKLPIAIATSLLVSGVIIGLRAQGVFEKAELLAYDYLVRLTAKSGSDPRLLLVAVDDSTLKKLNSDKISDRVLTETLQKLRKYEPRVITLDILRDIPIGEGREELINYVNGVYEPLEGKIKPIIFSCALPSEGKPEGIDPPPVIDADSAIGFVDLESDAKDMVGGEIVRRSPISSIPSEVAESSADNGSSSENTPQSNCYAPFSLSFLTALSYLQQDNIAIDISKMNEGIITVKDVNFESLAKKAGGYNSLDTGVYQIVLDYYYRQPAEVISLAKVLDGEITPEQIKDKVVYIGYTTKEDVHQTPYGIEPGVLIHGWATSQIISNVLEERSPVWYWSEPLEWLWIAVWGLGGGAIAWGLKPSWQIYTAKGVGAILIFGSSWWLFTQQGWIPMLPTILNLAIAGGVTKVVLTKLSPSLLSVVDKFGSESSVNFPPPIVNPSDSNSPPPTIVNHPSAGNSSPPTIVNNPSTPQPPQVYDPENPFAGQVLGDRYRLEKMLGKGGMSKVYLAYDTKLADRPVAIKIMTRYSASMNPALVKRFMREVKVISKVKSSNVVQVTDFGVTPTTEPFDGSPFYVMEYFQGRTLRELLAEVETLSAKQAIKLMLQVCHGLNKAHQHGIIHRDLKPDNIFLVSGGAFGEEAKILDFGIAKIVANDDDDPNQQTVATQAGSFIGTYRYASPEQCRGLPDIDLRTDIYSLGVILYEILSGHSPYDLDDQQTTHADWLVSHIRVEPKPLSSHTQCQNLPPGLEELVMKCLRKSPDDRFANLEALERALKSIMPNLF
ncbi:MAG: hypothetical protein Tsb0014_13300 [Pleurocapsa sp.]